MTGNRFSALLAPQRIGWVAALVTVAVWTTWITTSRMAMQGAQPLDGALLAFLRFGTAGVLLAPFWWRFRIIPKQSPKLALLGLLCAGLPYQLLVLEGLHHAPAAEAGPLLTGSLPLFIALLSATVLGEKLGRGRIAGVAFITVGVAFIMGHGLMNLEGGSWRGHLLVLGGALAWSIYTVAFRYSRLSGVEAAAFVSFWSVVLLVPVAGWRVLEGLQTTAPSLLLRHVLIQGVMAGVLALLIFTLALRHIGAARTTAVTALTPVTVTLVAVMLLGEVPSTLELLGCALVVFGVLVTSGVLRLPSRPSLLAGAMPSANLPSR
ncbi:DMT family transporter [Rhodovarius crocodyli]|uniref:DMT family transporter n=1 Tax=Rhodovarius crocodyli TaxID=1979269 RepID=A0A437MNA4_9PROT|nr:DMT family transporter [Rhodovarius crocodyli]RVT99119.1 DMT family transporter [Rhodovarius crocodyli]